MSPPRIFIVGPDGEATPQSTALVRRPSGSVVRVTPVGTRTDPGFFRKLLTNLNPLRQQTRAAMALSGVGLFALAMDVAATLNLGNPFLFYDRRETWKELSGNLKGARSDVWYGFFGQEGTGEGGMSSHWTGEAKSALASYIRFNLTGLYDELGKVSDQSSETMNNLYTEVLEYDQSVFGFYATTGPVLWSVAQMSANPMARGILIGAVTTAAGALGFLVKQYMDIFNVYEKQLNQQELKLNELRSLFYNSGDPARGPRSTLGLDPTIEAPGNPNDYWKPV